VVTITARRLVLRVPIKPDGAAGPIETVAGRIRGDDFAIGLSGALYIATHGQQTVMRLDPSGARATLAGPRAWYKKRNCSALKLAKRAGCSTLARELARQA